MLKAGFGRVNVTPMMGISLRGYYIPRYADGVLDELEVNALALECGDVKAVFLSVDHCGLSTEIYNDYSKHVSDATGIPVEGIFISSTHTHTAPDVILNAEDKLVREYTDFLRYKMADAARFALADLKAAKMGWGIGQAPNISFIRRFRMKDGSIQTNPGVNNPDIVAPIGDIDTRVNVLRFDQEGGESLVMVNFGNHPDVVGGCKISADWPGLLRHTVEKALDNTKCIFFNGAQGDVNHVNVHPKGGDLNDMFMDFDDVSRGYGHARYLGRVVAGGVLQAYDKVKYVDVDSIRYKQSVLPLPSNMPDPADLPEARRINELHQAGRDEELPYTGMMLTTVVAEAERMLNLEHGPEFFNMTLSGIAIGPVAFIGIPGEPFNGIGVEIKDTEGYEMIMPTCCTNGYEGYFPMMEAYVEGGYESRSSIFKAGVAELIIAEAKKVLKELEA